MVQGGQTGESGLGWNWGCSQHFRAGLHGKDLNWHWAGFRIQESVLVPQGGGVPCGVTAWPMDGGRGLPASDSRYSWRLASRSFESSSSSEPSASCPSNSRLSGASLAPWPSLASEPSSGQAAASERRPSSCAEKTRKTQLQKLSYFTV